MKKITSIIIKNSRRQEKQETIKELPKTGINVYTPMVIALVSLISLGLYFNKKNNK